MHICYYGLESTISCSIGVGSSLTLKYWTSLQIASKNSLAYFGRVMFAIFVNLDRSLW
jgi:hypothetical protein